MWKYRVQRRWSNRLTLYDQFIAHRLIAKHNLITDKRTKNFDFIFFFMMVSRVNVLLVKLFFFSFWHRRCGLCVYFFFRSGLWNSVFLHAFFWTPIFFLSNVPFTFWHVFISNHNLIAILFEWLQHHIVDILFTIFSLKRSKWYQNRKIREKKMTYSFFSSSYHTLWL